MSQAEKVIAENLGRIQSQIVEAAHRASREAAEIRLLAVTKYVDIEMTREVIRAGCRYLGESRPQHFVPKAEAISNENVCWHMIGQLQRNKIRRVLPYVGMLESVDSARLLEAIDRIAAEEKLDPVPVLLEINISGDATKGGFTPDNVSATLQQVPSFKNVQVKGLMGMASFGGGVERARKDFERLRQLRDKLQLEIGDTVSLNELSMGMSRDFSEAILEGSTIVRVGSALFEGLL
jgi:PLP dependent protein